MLEKEIEINFDQIKIRRFTSRDIQRKVDWINDGRNNRYLHYDLPLEYEKTCQWFERIRNEENRLDLIIEYEHIPVGIIGLLDIDFKNLKAEEYITIGNQNYKGKGIATQAGTLLQNYAFSQIGLNKIFAYVEIENYASISLYRKRGFVEEGYLKDDLFFNGRFLDRYIFALYKETM